jgi:hypothetical protein
MQTVNKMSGKKAKEKQKMHYFKLIQKHEPVHPEELKTEYGIKKVRYDYIDELCYDKQIEREKYEKKYTLLFMPGHKKKADERYRKDFNLNKHLEDIKSKVILPWIRQLKPISNICVKPINITNKNLFKDFKKNHLKSEFNNPFEKLGQYNTIYGEMYLIKVRLYRHILYQIIENEFDKSPAELRYKEDPMLEFEKERFNFMDEIDGSRFEFVDWILKSINEFYPNFDEESVEYIVANLSSSIKEKDNFYEYYISGIYFGYIEKEKFEKNYFLKEMDECIKNILIQVQQSKKVQKEINELYEKQGELNSCIIEMKETLEKYLNLPILPGNCDYCS